MRRYVSAFLLPLLLVCSVGWTKIGLNFRATSGYVTDGTDETYVIADIYPVTRATVTFGWDVCGDCERNRDSALDRRLAGVNKRVNDATQNTFRVDLPATGNYKICLALGDGTEIQGYQYLQVKDDTTVEFTITDTDGTAAANFDDANGTNHTAAAWPGSHTCRTGVNFASTILRVVVGSPAAQAGESTLAHLYIEQESSSQVLFLHGQGDY